MLEETLRARTEIAADGCDFALLSSIHNVTYASGFEVPTPIGAGAETAYGPSLALLDARSDGSRLIVSAANAAAAQAQSQLRDTAVFATFDSFTPRDSKAEFVDQARTALLDAGLRSTPATLGVEARSTPWAITEMLVREFPHLTLVDVDDALARARAIKTPREIERLRRAAQVCAAGHRALAELCRTAGRTEFEMWGEICRTMFDVVGRDVPVTGELVTGPRTTTVNYPGGPRTRTTERGDAALMDISQRVDGYWSDCTNTHVVEAEPTPTQRRFAHVSQAAFAACVERLRPGVRASEAWQAADAVYRDAGIPMPHYMGHQIGVVVNELPRLVPYDHTEIRAGMVFAVEPGAYQGAGGAFGARSEKMVLVTEAGPEILADFEWGIL